MARLRRCVAGSGALDQYVRIPFEIEPERPPEVDVREGRWADSPQPVLFNSDAVTLEACDDCVHAARVPGPHDVGQQRVRAGDGHHLLAPPASLRRHLSAVNRSLQLVNRFPAIEQRVNLGFREQRNVEDSYLNWKRLRISTQRTDALNGCHDLPKDQ